jgi:hypothetical protein
MLGRASVRRRLPRNGAVIPLVAVSLLALLGVLAIALDGGLLLTERRHAQGVADAAALAAGIYLYQHYGTDKGLDPKGYAQQNALAYAAANGYSNDGAVSTVTVNIPPTSGDYVGKPGYAEVLVQYNQPRYFSGIFGTKPIPVQARAVASGLTKNNNPAILVLNPSVAKALNVTGPGDVNVNSGTVVVDSSNSQAAVLTGSGNVNTSEVDITGSGPGYSAAGSGRFSTSPTSGNVKTGQTATPDPLANLSAPDPTSLPIQSPRQLNLSNSTTLLPGRYIGGIGISGGNITLSPGIYYMDHGGFSVSNGKVTGDGVMIYNDPTPASGQKVTITGGTFDITAPTTGVYQGMVIFQARGAGNVPIAITGSQQCNMIGTVYAPSSPVQVTGSGGATLGSEFVSDTLTVTGSGPFNIDWGGSAPPQAKDIRLVE